MRIRIEVLAILVSLASPLAAQAPSDAGVSLGAKSGLIGSFGVGAGPLGLAGQLALGLRAPPGDFVTRAVGFADVGIQLDLWGGGSGSADFRGSSDVGILYGRRAAWGSDNWVRLLAGPARVHVARFEPTLGLACQLDVAWSARGGLSVFTNFNGGRSYWGLFMMAHF